MGESRHAGAFRVGAWIVDPASREIRAVVDDAAEGRAGSDDVQRLGHKPLTVLQHLASNPGAVVTKDELIDNVWDGAATTDDAVMAVVYELRKALGDDAKSPRYVETIRQRGYRLVADVAPLDDCGGQDGVSDDSEADSEAARGDQISDGPGAASADGAERQAGETSKGVSDDSGVGHSEAASPISPRRRLRPIVPVLGLGLLIALALIWFDAADRAHGPAGSEAQAGGETQPDEHQVEEIPEIRSLAIRPLAAFGDQCLEEPFVDSLTELLIAELVHGPPLEILGTGDGTPWPSEPTADAVIEGSIIRSGDGLWVNVRLVESTSGRLIWGASYERQGVDLLLERALASQIARDVEGLIATEARPLSDDE